MDIFNKKLKKYVGIGRIIKIIAIYSPRILDDLFLNIPNFIRHRIQGIIYIITNIPFIIHIVKQDDELSSYDKDMRKSRKRIFFEILVWAIKYGEINNAYFQYLFDRKHDPVDQSEYMPYRLYCFLHRKNEQRS